MWLFNPRVAVFTIIMIICEILNKFRNLWNRILGVAVGRVLCWVVNDQVGGGRVGPVYWMSSLGGAPAAGTA